MRLLEADLRAASITASALGSRRTTQASNFSRFSRSRAAADMSTVATPNCRKQSARIVRAGAAISTRAARAAFFLGATAADRVASRVLSRKDMRVCLTTLLCLVYRRKERIWTGVPGYRSAITGVHGWVGVGYSVQRRKSNAPFVPP